MNREWNEEEISRALRNSSAPRPEPVAFDRVWFKIEERLTDRQRSWWHHFVWRPWGHPIRWVMVAGCLSVVFSGALYHSNSVERVELGSYVMSLSNPTAGVVNDLGIVKETALLKGSNRAESRSDLLDEDQNDPLSGDELFL